MSASLSNTDISHFSDLSQGLNTNVSWEGLGTFDQIYVRGAPQYGGAFDAITWKASN